MTFKTLREKTSQALHFDHKFKPASSPRVEQMYKEISAFAARLKVCDKYVRNLKKATLGMINITEDTLTAPLPKVYTTHTQTGKLLVEESKALNAGDDAVQITQLAQISKQASRRLDEDVLLPMERWQKGYADVKKRKHTLDEFRVKFDAEKRAMTKLEQQKLKKEQAAGQLDNKQLRRIETKSVKYNAAEQAWVQYEQQTADALAHLVVEAKKIRMYLTRAMQVEGEMFSAAVDIPAVSDAALAGENPSIERMHTAHNIPGMPAGSAYAGSHHSESVRADSVRGESQKAGPSGYNTPEGSVKEYPVSGKSPVGAYGSSPGTPAPGTPTHARVVSPLSDTPPLAGHAGPDGIKIPPQVDMPAEEEYDYPSPPSNYPASATGGQREPQAMQAY